MSFISTSATVMITSAKIYHSKRLAIKRLKLMARSNLYRLKLSISAKETAPGTPVSGSVSPKTAEAYGRYLSLSYAEAVQEIYLITQACLKPLGKGGGRLLKSSHKFLPQPWPFSGPTTNSIIEMFLILFCGSLAAR